MQEEWIHQDVRIAVSRDHTLEDESKDHLPPGSGSRSTLFPLPPDLSQLGIVDPLIAGKEDGMRRLPQSLSVSILKVQIQGGELVEPPGTS